MPPPQVKCFATPKDGAEEDCCSWRVPCGRELDTFDAANDASVRETLAAAVASFGVLGG